MLPWMEETEEDRAGVRVYEGLKNYLGEKEFIWKNQRR